MIKTNSKYDMVPIQISVKHWPFRLVRSVWKYFAFVPVLKYGFKCGSCIEACSST
jgi:hypothetical protein